MKFERLVDEVRYLAKLRSDDDAVRAIRAALQTLSGQLTSEEAANMASELPQEIAFYLLRNSNHPPDSMDLDEFYHGVAVRENVDLPTAVLHAKVVARVLDEIFSQEKREESPMQWPAAFVELLDLRQTDEPLRKAA